MDQVMYSVLQVVFYDLWSMPNSSLCSIMFYAQADLRFLVVFLSQVDLLVGSGRIPQLLVI